MRWLWQFITLRAALNLYLPRPREEVTHRFAERVRPGQRSWSVLLPPAGMYLTGEGSADTFSVGCIRCAYVNNKCRLRWVVAHGKFQDAPNGTAASVIVRHGLDKVCMNVLLLTLSLTALIGWPLLMLEGSVGPVLAAGCGWPALVLPALWLFCNVWWWREVQDGRGQLARELESCG